MNRINWAVLTASALIFGVFLPRGEGGRANGERACGNVEARFQHARAGRQEDRFLGPIRKAY
jgi:hypothetical protein